MRGHAVYARRMSSLELDLVETRILGCLLEKERVTPEQYPMSLNGILMASNQSTNRDPITNFEERTVQEGLDSLREKKLVVMLHMAGARVPKYRHNLSEHFELTEAETALFCVLLLRGPQTPGELRTRTERMHSFPSLEEVERSLLELCKGDEPIVRILPARSGQKERRFQQTTSSAEASTSYEQPPSSGRYGAVETVLPSPPSQVALLREEVGQLRADLLALREDFAAFRKQFE